MGACHYNNAMPAKSPNDYQLFYLLCRRSKRCAEGKFDMKEDVGITEQVDWGPRKTREQSAHMYPEDDKGVKQTARIVWFCQKLLPDKTGVLF